MTLLLWERREGLYMSLHEELVSPESGHETRRDGQTFGHGTSDVVMETSWMDDGGGETGLGRGEMRERAEG